jgi:hypothetical protein
MQVVVPVRETAAQALAAALQATSLYSLQRVLELLTSMYNHSEWHVRHGAYTGIKYLLASRWALLSNLLILYAVLRWEGQGWFCHIAVDWLCEQHVCMGFLTLYCLLAGLGLACMRNPAVCRCGGLEPSQLQTAAQIMHTCEGQQVKPSKQAVQDAWQVGR